MWWFLRHGPTESNQQKLIQGRLDIPLSSTGKSAVAKWVAEAKLDPAPEVIFTSPLSRARSTADIITAVWSLPVVESEELLEWSLGAAEGSTLASFQQRHPQYPIRWDDFDFRYPDGESKRELYERAVRFCITLRNESRTPLIIAHQAILNYLITAALGLPGTAAVPFRLANCGLAVIEPGVPYGRLVRFDGQQIEG